MNRWDEFFSIYPADYKSVQKFYNEMPFDYERDTIDLMERVQSRKLEKSYLSLLPLKDLTGLRIVDVGCGVGELANAIMLNYDATVVGIDISSKAIKIAQRTAELLSLQTQFIEADLFSFYPDKYFNILLSIGVLHHTKCLEDGLRHCLSHLLEPGGLAVIALYHRYGRQAFKEYFARLKQDGKKNKELFIIFKQMFTRFSNEANAWSWFRDQVFHPHETQTTMLEILPVLKKEGCSLLNADIPGFGPNISEKKLKIIEKRMKQQGDRMIQAGKYWHGLFCFVVKKQPN